MFLVHRITLRSWGIWVTKNFQKYYLNCVKIKIKCKFDFVKIYNPNFVIFVRRLSNKHFCKLDKILRTFCSRQIFVHPV